MAAAVSKLPLTPDNETARRWLEHELAKPEYAAARPNWFDVLSKRVADWFESLHVHGGGGGASAWLAVIGAVIAAVIIVGALLRFGLPRLNRRARGAALSGDVADVRTAAELRAAADRAAGAGEWELAVVERFRAIAASLAERTVITVQPGTTAHEVAEAAASVFSAEVAALRDAAAIFDAARYLGQRMSAGEHDRLRTLDERLRRMTPVFSGAPQ
jgi:hypothetical protein